MKYESETFDAVACSAAAVAGFSVNVVADVRPVIAEVVPSHAGYNQNLLRKLIE